MGDLKHILPFMIPIVAIVMGIGLAMLFVWLDYSRKRELLEAHHKERLAAIERGMEVPPLPTELFQQGRSATVATDYLRRGLIWLLVGVALMVAVVLNSNPSNAAWGLLPTAVGLAYLIYYATVSRQKPTASDVR